MADRDTGRTNRWDWEVRLRVTGTFFIIWAAFWFGSMVLSFLWPGRICLALPGEELIPFIPWLVPLYLSLDLMVPVVALLAPDLDTLRRVYRVMLVQTGIAAVVYTLVPQRLAFDGHELGGVWDSLAHHTRSANLGWHADAPSLHVSYAFTLASLLFPRLSFNRPGMVTFLGWVWADGVMASTLFVHEHHLVDLISGIALAWWTCRWAEGQRMPFP